MKIIENNFNSKLSKSKPKVAICEWCGSKLEYEDSDIDYREYGCGYIHCPCCGEDSELDDEVIQLTKDNIQFPNHFVRYEEKDDEYTHVTGSEVKKHIQKAIGYFRQNKDDDCGYYSSEIGDAYFCTKRYPGDEEYRVVVARGYWETSIPFEEEDYSYD